MSSGLGNNTATPLVNGSTISNLSNVPESKTPQVSKMHVPLKTFPMQTSRQGGHTIFYGPYDHNTGLRIAGALSTFLFAIILYALYKLKCRRDRWSSEDRQFIEYYSRLLTDKWTGKRRRRQVRRDHQRTLDSTARWVHALPPDAKLKSAPVRRNTTVYHMCLESFKTSACPACSISDVSSVLHKPSGGPSLKPLNVNPDVRLTFPQRTLLGKTTPYNTTHELLAWNPINFLTIPGPASTSKEKTLLKAQSMDESHSPGYADEGEENSLSNLVKDPDKWPGRTQKAAFRTNTLTSSQEIQALLTLENNPSKDSMESNF